MYLNGPRPGGWPVTRSGPDEARKDRDFWGEIKSIDSKSEERQSFNWSIFVFELDTRGSEVQTIMFPYPAAGPTLHDLKSWSLLRCIHRPSGGRNVVTSDRR